MHLDGYGCAGTNAVSYGLACLELEAGDSGVRSMVSVQGSLAMFAIWKFGSEEQKQTWLPRMADRRGDRLLRADRGRLRLQPGRDAHPGPARRGGRGDWVLNGTKMWITNGSVADVAVVWAQTDEGDEHEAGQRHPRLRGAHRHPGLLGRAKIKHKLSLRASVTSELVLERRPAARRRGAARGDRPARTAVVPERGAVRHRLRRPRGGPGLPGDGARPTPASREVFDRPLAAFQLTQAKLADMALELQKGFLLALHLGRLKDDHQLDPRQVSLGKLNNVREAIDDRPRVPHHPGRQRDHR